MNNSKTVNSNPEKTGEKPKKVIANMFAFGFGSISIVAIATCIILIILIKGVSGLVMGMHREETAIKEGLLLATSVREQYMHQARWIIDGSQKHLDKYADCLSLIDKGTQVLESFVPNSELYRLEEIKEKSHKMDDIFQGQIRRAVGDRDWDSISKYHEAGEILSEEMILQADFVAKMVERQMAGAHASASNKTQLALLTGVSGIFIILLLSVAYTHRLRKAVLKPLKQLSHAARLFGAGNFKNRVGQLGEGELQEVAQAFDSMVEAILDREKKLVKSERMAVIGQLAAGVAHEINNPIAIIRGYLKTMTVESSMEDLMEELAIIDEEASACQRIAEDLVSYSRTSQIHTEEVAIDELLDQTAKRFRELPEAQNITLRTHINPGRVQADRSRMRQVILNLLLNAAQVSKQGSCIRVEGFPEDESRYRIVVSDSGPGILEEDAERVFEPFFSKRPGGSGLGLAVCQGIIQAHNGSIRFEKRNEGGTRFIVDVPIEKEK